MEVTVKLLVVTLTGNFCTATCDGRAGTVDIEVHSTLGAATSAAGQALPEAQQAEPLVRSERLIRRDVPPIQEGSRPQDERIPTNADEEIPADSVLQRTIHTLRHQRDAVFPASLITAAGPGRLPDNSDAWNASMGAMQDLSKKTWFDCDLKYGQGMLKKMMQIDSAHHLCTGKSSTVTYHEREPFDVPRYMCELKNVLVSKEGTTVADCKQSGDFKSITSKQGITEDNIFGKYTKFGNFNLVTGPLQCKTTANDKAIVQVPVNTENFYEWYNDWVTLFETLAAMKWDPKDVDLYLMGDISGNGKPFKDPFDEAWSRAFKADRLHIGSREKLFGTGICFPRLITAPQGGLSTISANGGRGGVVGCYSPTVAASALYLQALFPPAASTKITAPKKTVTLLLRKGKTRRFQNDDVVISDIKRVLPEDWTLRLYVPEEVPDFSEQLSIAASTQVLVGVHGAGMMHVLFLPPKARVVELFCGDRPMENHHFRNIVQLSEMDTTHFYSHYFAAWKVDCQMDIKLVTDAIAAYNADPGSLPN